MLPPPASLFYPLSLSPSLEMLMYSRVRMSSICRITDPELAGGRKAEKNICAMLSVAQTLAYPFSHLILTAILHGEGVSCPAFCILRKLTQRV